MRWRPRRRRNSSADDADPRHGQPKYAASWSLRPWLLIKALEIGFTDRIEPFAAAENNGAFRAFPPTVPMLLAGERTVSDSLGIALYLAERHPDVRLEDEAARAWTICTVAGMHGGFLRSA